MSLKPKFLALGGATLMACSILASPITNAEPTQPAPVATTVAPASPVTTLVTPGTTTNSGTTVASTTSAPTTKPNANVPLASMTCEDFGILHGLLAPAATTTTSSSSTATAAPTTVTTTTSTPAKLYGPEGKFQLTNKWADHDLFRSSLRPSKAQIELNKYDDADDYKYFAGEKAVECGLIDRAPYVPNILTDPIGVIRLFLTADFATLFKLAQSPDVRNIWSQVIRVDREIGNLGKAVKSMTAPTTTIVVYE